MANRLECSKNYSGSIQSYDVGDLTSNRLSREVLVWWRLSIPMEWDTLNSICWGIICSPIAIRMSFLCYQILSILRSLIICQRIHILLANSCLPKRKSLSFFEWGFYCRRSLSFLAILLSKLIRLSFWFLDLGLDSFFGLKFWSRFNSNLEKLLLKFGLAKYFRNSKYALKHLFQLITD